MQTLEAIRAYILYFCLAALAIALLGLLAYSMSGMISRLFRWIKSHPVLALMLSAPVAVFVLHGSTKPPTPVTPTVKGITLGSPMETPTEIELAWTPDDGTVIQSNQLVRVLYRSAAEPKWAVALEGYGLTNATIKGFFISTDTDWIVEVEGLTNNVEEVQR